MRRFSIIFPSQIVIPPQESECSRVYFVSWLLKFEVQLPKIELEMRRNARKLVSRLSVSGV